MRSGHGKKHESVISTAATMRVLNILRHWVSKHAQVQYIFVEMTVTLH